MKVELAADTARQEGIGTAIFGIADDWMAERRHVRAKLVRAASQGLKLDPGGSIAGAVDDPPTGLGGEAMLMVDMHLLAASAGLLRERKIDLAFVARRNTYDQRPVHLARGAARKCLGKM